MSLPECLPACLYVIFNQFIRPKIIITADQVRALFCADNQMTIPVATIVQLVQEGIEHLDDLQNFDKDSLKDVANNLRNTGGRIPHPDPNSQENETISTPPFVFGVNSQKRMLEACELVRFYDTIKRPITTTNLLHRPVIRNSLYNGKQWFLGKIEMYLKSPRHQKESQSINGRKPSRISFAVN